MFGALLTITVGLLALSAPLGDTGCGRALEHRDRAATLYAAQDLRKAIDEIKLAIEDCPQDPFYLFMLANAAFRAGQFSESAELYDRFLARRPNDFEGHLSLGFVLHRLARHTEALTHLLEAVRLDPLSPLARAALTVEFKNAGDSESASVEGAETLDLLRGTQWRLELDVRWSIEMEHDFRSAVKEFDKNPK